MSLAPPRADAIHLATWLLLLNALVGVAIASLLWQISSPAARKLSALLVAIALTMVCFQVWDNANIGAMLDLSQEWSGRTAPGDLAAQIRAGRLVAHYAELASVDAFIATMYVLLLRLRLLPGWLGGFGLLTVALHFFGLLLPMMLGTAGITALGASMALSHVMSGVWLLVQRPRS
jgi:hypothetical protein